MHCKYAYITAYMILKHLITHNKYSEECGLVILRDYICKLKPDSCLNVTHGFWNAAIKNNEYG